MENIVVIFQFYLIYNFPSFGQISYFLSIKLNSFLKQQMNNCGCRSPTLTGSYWKSMQVKATKSAAMVCRSWPVWLKVVTGSPGLGLNNSCGLRARRKRSPRWRRSWRRAAWCRRSMSTSTVALSAVWPSKQRRSWRLIPSTISSVMPPSVDCANETSGQFKLY